jgi:hypothetical protein
MPGLANSFRVKERDLRGHASGVASMLFGPNGCTKDILVPLGFELFLLLKLGKFVHFLCYRFDPGLVKLNLDIQYLRYTCLKLEIATFVKAFKQVGLLGGYYILSFMPPPIDLPLVSTRAKTDFIYVAQC